MAEVTVRILESIILTNGSKGYTQGNTKYYLSYSLISQGTLVNVTIQYRLGTYGFLSSKEIKENGTPNERLLD